MEVTLPDFTLRVLLGLLLGALIGLERQSRSSLAGLRTNALVAVSSAMFVVIASLEPGTLDHTRIAAQVVSGVGFLGAGAILRDGLNVRGLNTAATLWGSAAVGSLAGLGFTGQATIGALMVVIAHPLLRILEDKLDQRRNLKPESTLFQMELSCLPEDEPWVRRMLLSHLQKTGCQILKVQVDERHGKLHFMLELLGEGGEALGPLMQQMLLERTIQNVHCQTLIRPGQVT